MHMSNKAVSILAVAALAAGLLVGAGACRRSGAPAGALKKKAGEKVARIVFVGKKDACSCTKARVKESWEAMQFALKKHGDVKVERLEMDVHNAKVKALRGQRRFMTLPALYFFNPKGKLVAMLEGELKPDQITEALK